MTAARRRSGGRPGRPPGRGAPGESRGVAYAALSAVTTEDAYANLALPRLLSDRGLTGVDAALATELTYGTLRRRGTLDAVVAVAADRDVDAIDPAVLNVLRLGTYQLLYTRVARHAAVSTAVALVRHEVGHRPAGFVNAVLRRVSARELSSWLAELSTGDAVADLALRHSHPAWIVAAFAAALDDTDEVAAALAADNEPPAVHLCARPGRLDRAELAAGTGGTPGPWSPYAVRLAGGAPGDIEAVATGAAHVQDEGSQLVAAVLADAPLTGRDERWLDLCAGPGGKAALLGALAAQRGATVTAVEIAEHRADLVRQTTRGLPVTTITADGARFGAEADFDRVLVDVPCTGLGALRRRPDARWRRSKSDVADLVPQQRRLLAAALRLVRPGGVVAYVTCSPMLAETREVVAASRADAESIPVRPQLPSGMPDLDDTPWVQLWPHQHGTDAMFCALLRKPV